MGFGRAGGRLTLGARVLGVLVRGLVDDGGVFEGAQVEHADGTVCAAGHEDVDGAGAEAHVVDFFVMGDELGFGGQGGNVPYRTRGVNAAGDDELWRQGVPVQRGEGRGMFGGFGIREESQRSELLGRGFAGVYRRGAVYGVGCCGTSIAG